MFIELVSFPHSTTEITQGTFELASIILNVSILSLLIRK